MEYAELAHFGDVQEELVFQPHRGETTWLMNGSVLARRLPRTKTASKASIFDDFVRWIKR